MTITMTLKRILLMATIVMVIVMVIVADWANAQSAPEFLVTWKANTYVPPEYQGKALPVPGSVIELAFEIIDNGQIANISQNRVRWTINNKVVSRANGQKRLTYQIPAFISGDLDLKITVLDYAGTDQEAFVTIPITRPKVIIDAPFVDSEIGAETAALGALSYFFTAAKIDELNFNWVVNSLKAAGDVLRPWILELDTSGNPSGRHISINLTVSNSQNAMETAVQTKLLTIE